MLNPWRFNVGNLVQLVRGGRVWTVMWRGYLLERHNGGNFRTYVYRLDNDFWDCYHQEELTEA